MSKTIRCKKCKSLVGDDGMTAGERVMKAFDGPWKFSKLTGIQYTTCCRINYPITTPGGKGGVILAKYFDVILKAAKDNGITLTKSDLV